MIARLGQTVLALAAVTAVVAGCGGGGNSSESAAPPATETSAQGASDANAWAASFCGYAKTWKTSLQEASAMVKNADTKASTTAALTTAKSSTVLFQQQLMRLGQPAGSSSQVTQQLRQYANRLKTSYQSLQAVLSEPSGSATELKTKVQSARATLTVMSTQLQQAYAYLTGVNASPQLKQALTSNATCRATFG
jgi:hypothetical protein